MTDPIPDGVPHQPTDEEIAEMEKQNPMVAALMRDNRAPKQETIKKVPLTDDEAGVMLGLLCARNAIEQQMLAYQTEEIGKRLGIHSSLFVHIDAKEKWVSVKE